MEDNLQSFSQVVLKRHLGSYFRHAFRLKGGESIDNGFYDDARTSRCFRRTRWPKKNEIGRSLKGFSSKVHAIVDSRGKPIHLVISAGQQPDVKVAPQLIAHARGKVVIADKVYDAAVLARSIEAQGRIAMIPCRSNRIFARKIDYRVYRRRIKVEHSFHRLNRFRSISSRFAKTPLCFLCLVKVPCIAIWVI